MRGLRQPVVIRPQGIANVVLRAGEMQCIRGPQTKVATELRGLQLDRLGHVQWLELLEKLAIGALQDRIATLDLDWLGSHPLPAYARRRERRFLASKMLLIAILAMPVRQPCARENLR